MWKRYLLANPVIFVSKCSQIWAIENSGNGKRKPLNPDAHVKRLINDHL